MPPIFKLPSLFSRRPSLQPAASAFQLAASAVQPAASAPIAAPGRSLASAPIAAPGRSFRVFQPIASSQRGPGGGHVARVALLVVVAAALIAWDVRGLQPWTRNVAKVAQVAQEGTNGHAESQGVGGGSKSDAGSGKGVPGSESGDSSSGGSKNGDSDSGDSKNGGSSGGDRGGFVEYRGAPWKAAVGAWLLACRDQLTPVTVGEALPSRACPGNCSGNGVCNYELGECRCRHGYQGSYCSKPHLHQCNLPASPQWPVGAWVASICPAHCDTHTALCFCGEGTRFPYRPITHPCGFVFRNNDFVFNEVDKDLLFQNHTGYCNADPRVGFQRDYTGCGVCDVDGFLGPFCDTQVDSFCVNQCSLHGTCHRGYCECSDGFFGIDCSLPSASTPRALFTQPYTQPQLDGPPADVASSSSAGSATVGSNTTDHPTAHDLKRRMLHAGDGELENHTEPAAAAAAAAVAVDAATSARARPLWQQLAAAGAGAAATAGVGQRHIKHLANREWAARQMKRLASRRWVRRSRPLIYIYDLPGEFTFHHLEARKIRAYCSTRLYGLRNETLYNHFQLYGMEVAVLESLLASPHRTTNASAADYFLVPVMGGCITARADDSPSTSMRGKFSNRRSHFAAHYYQQALEHIRSAYPFWNRTGGRDHIWTFPWDEGACSAPKDVFNGIMLSHWGNTMTAHNRSTTAYLLDSWREIPEALRGRHACFDPLKDVVMPAFKPPSAEHLRDRLWLNPVENRPRLFYFAGNLGSNFTDGRPEANYSMGIRQKVASYFASERNKHGQVGLLSQADVLVHPGPVSDYSMQLSQSRFCGVFPGDGFSARMEDSLLHGCIPVIIQDGIELPFEHFLNYPSFTVRISEADIPNLVTVLNSFAPEQVRAMQWAASLVWMRWFYRWAVVLEAGRQRAQGKEEGQWVGELEGMEGDDAVDTLLQILHVKLHRDAWRKQHDKMDSQTGTEPTCHA